MKLTAPHSKTRVTGHAAGVVWRLLALLIIVTPMAACSNGLDFKGFSLFGNKDDLGPELPADKLYNEGVFLLKSALLAQGAEGEGNP